MNSGATDMKVSYMPNETIPVGYCQCGCGTHVGFWGFNDRKNNKVKGQPRRYVKGHNAYSGLTTEERLDSHIDKRGPSDCWEWTGNRDHKGYGRFQLETRTSDRAHRVTYRFKNGQIPEGLIVRHKCDNPPCCNPAHLELGTVQDNVMDRNKRQRGRYRYVEDDVVRAIRRDLKAGHAGVTIAARYDVTGTTVSRIRLNRGRYALVE